jgi:hypothetical protein
MRGLKRDRAASIVIRSHAFIQNVRRGHYELGADARDHLYVSRPRSTNWPKHSDQHWRQRAGPRHVMN